jgi:hypothetical protein
MTFEEKSIQKEASHAIQLLNGKSEKTSNFMELRKKYLEITC